MEETKSKWASRTVWMAVFGVLNAVVLLYRQIFGEPPEQVTELQAKQEEIITAIQAVILLVTSFGSGVFRIRAKTQLK